MHAVDSAVLAVAAKQCGAFSRSQVLGAGGNDELIRRRVDFGWWVVAVPGVYVVPGAERTWRQRLWIAFLAAGEEAVVSFDSAGQLLGIPNVQHGQLILTVPHSGWHRIDGVFVHQISDVLPEHRTEVDGLPVTTVARTIVDLAAEVSPIRLQRIVEDSKHRGLVAYAAIGAVAKAVSRRGKPGMRKLARTLDVLEGRQKATPNSVLERETLPLFRRAGMPPPELQFPFPGRQFGTGRVDFAYPLVKLIYETDGRTWHQRIADVRRDRERDMEAARHGWQTVRPMYEDVVGAPEQTIKMLWEVYQQRLALFSTQ